MTAVAQAARRRDLPEAERVVRVERARRGVRLELAELWRFRELLFFLVWRDVKVRYKQTLIGVSWAVIQPFVSMLIFTVIFGRLAHVGSEYGEPYPLFVFTGLLPWMYFSTSLTQSSTSLVGNAPLVTKVYVPRLMIPLGSIVAPVVDFAMAFVVLIGMFAYYGRAPHWHAVALPVFLGMALTTAFGVGLWLAVLNVRYRDVAYVIPFLTQVWLFATPVVYPVTLVPERWRWLLALNPMTGVIDGVRWTVLGKGLPHYTVFATSAGVAVCLALSGIWFFRRLERYFADVI